MTRYRRRGDWQQWHTYPRRWMDMAEQAGLHRLARYARESAGHTVAG